MTVPSSGETFAKLIHHIREAQSCAATMSHLEGLNQGNALIVKGWLGISELLGRLVIRITEIAAGKLH